ncbi:unnamed protein product [Meloidogyne enterolobii]|uniref:Uncharacterized protein n=1 Tax=Meloidogyne enterolobii TaxID=390850 RepID=A0ACB1AQH1_MELEN
MSESNFCILLKIVFIILYKSGKYLQACIQKEPIDRPTIDDILKFLNGDITHFDYEPREMEKETGKKPKEEEKSSKGKRPEIRGKGKHSGGKKEKHLKLG